MRGAPFIPDHQMITSPADHGSNYSSQASHYSFTTISILLLTMLQHPPNAIAEPAKPLLTDIRFEKASSQEEMIHISVRDFSPPSCSPLRETTRVWSVTSSAPAWLAR